MTTPATPSAEAVQAARALTDQGAHQLYVQGNGWCAPEEVASLIDRETGLPALKARVAELGAERDAEMLRVKACEHIAECEGDWESLRNTCPSTMAVAALRDRVAELEGALRESLALNVNWVSDAEPETLAYYSEYKAVIAQARQALSHPEGGAK